VLHPCSIVVAAQRLFRANEVDLANDGVSGETTVDSPSWEYKREFAVIIFSFCYLEKFNI